MKRLIAAVSFAVLASPVLATPFEQTQFDRQLPQVGNAVASQDRLAQYTGATRSDREIATEVSAASSFADDHNFIAPAQ
jgi:hypothetical protein